MSKIFFTVIGIYCTFVLVTADAKEKAKIALKIDLSKETSDELLSEMRGLQSNMQMLLEKVSKGEWPEVEKRGREISELVLSPIKKKTKLPDGFLKHAKTLQVAGADLALAAKNRHAGPVLANYNRLLSTCMKCHSDYAPNYFDHTKEYTPPEEMPKKYYKSPNVWH